MFTIICNMTLCKNNDKGKCSLEEITIKGIHFIQEGFKQFNCEDYILDGNKLRKSYVDISSYKIDR
jgi:hypothetical protein